MTLIDRPPANPGVIHRVPHRNGEKSERKQHSLDDRSEAVTLRGLIRSGCQVRVFSA